MQLRLATLIIARNVTFSNELGRYGQEYCFTASSPKKIRHQLHRGNPSRVSRPRSEETFEIQKPTDCGDVEEMLHLQESLSTTNGKSVAFWLRKVYMSFRGFELGTFDSSVLAATKKDQST